MAYNFAQEQYTNLQFFLSALSLGFEQKDARQIWGLLGKLFTRRCQAPISVPKWAPPALQSICLWVSAYVRAAEMWWLTMLLYSMTAQLPSQSCVRVFMMRLFCLNLQVWKGM
jgi:hypothetical protein